MKKVILNYKPETTVSINKFDKYKLYFSKTSTGLYKLQEINSKWVFIRLIGSIGTSNDSYNKVSDALKYQIGINDVYEFDNLEEAMKELL